MVMEGMSMVTKGREGGGVVMEGMGVVMKGKGKGRDRCGDER